jgi:hypothetical protein
VAVTPIDVDKRKPRRRRALLLAACAVGLSVGACLSPTLPLPPPEEPETMRPNADGISWDIRGSCSLGAEVVVVNLSTGRGAVYVDQARLGRYGVTIEARACDVLTVKQSLGDETSGETRFVLEEREDGVSTDPAACSP